MRTQIRKNRNLHGNVPDCYPVAFLPVDATNGLAFLGHSALPKTASRRDGNIAALEERCKEIPAICANDTRGKGFSVCQDCQPESAKGQRRRRAEQTGETFGFKNITQSGKQTVRPPTTKRNITSSGIPLPISPANTAAEAS